MLDGLTDTGFTTAGWLRRARRADRYRRDYLNKMLTNRSTDGRLRPEIRTLGTRTGRWAVGGAIPLQQIPATGGLRACLIPDDGRVLVSYDYDSIEFVTLAALSADPGMLTVLRTGADPHLAAADVIWPGTAALSADDPERARRRQQAKQFTHGLGYGMGPRTLAARSGLSLPAATTARDRLRRAWPGASRAMDTIRRDYWRGQRDLRSPFGRPYRIPTRNARPVEHRALNNLNQGTARDVMMHDLITLEDAGLQPWLTLHDEIVIECETADADQVADLMRRSMSHNPHPALGVPIHVKGGILGTSWGKP